MPRRSQDVRSLGKSGSRVEAPPLPSLTRNGPRLELSSVNLYLTAYVSDVVGFPSTKLPLECTNQMDCTVKHFGADMKFAIVSILALLFSAPATAAETAAMFAKSVITEPGLHPWTIVTFPDECLVVEFKLDPFVAKQRDLKSEFGAIARTVVPAALDKFPKLNSVQLTGLVTVRDKRGNDHEIQAVVVKFYRANSTSIKWDTVNPADVIDISDKKTVSPMLAGTVAR
jgi:hypothetical protein